VLDFRIDGTDEMRASWESVVRVSTWNRDVCDVAIILGSVLDFGLGAFEPELVVVSLRDKSLKEEEVTSDLTLSGLVDLGFGIIMRRRYMQAVTGRFQRRASHSRFR
jgi:hypothetical protein